MSSSANDAPPDFGDRFRVRSKLGGGGMGDVYEAHDTVLQRTVAVKTLTPGRSAAAEAIDRLHREARACAGLTHPGIVTVHDVLQADGRVYIVMERLEGVSLDEALRSGRLASFEVKIGIVVQILDALQYAHDQGVVHRDIKPRNVQLLPDDAVKLLDFGLARIAGEDALTVAGTMMGTPHYASPEQLRGEPVDAGTDVYSTGILTYELLARRRPYDGDTVASVVTKVLTDPLPAMETSWSAAFPELERIVTRAAAKGRPDRYASAEDMRNALAAFLAASRDAIVSKQAEVVVTAQRAVIEAKTLLASGRAAAAEALLTEALRSNPDAEEARALLRTDSAGPPPAAAAAPLAGSPAAPLPTVRLGADRRPAPPPAPPAGAAPADSRAPGRRFGRRAAWSMAAAAAALLAAGAWLLGPRPSSPGSPPGRAAPPPAAGPARAAGPPSPAVVTPPAPVVVTPPAAAVAPPPAAAVTPPAAAAAAGPATAERAPAAGAGRAGPPPVPGGETPAPPARSAKALYYAQTQPAQAAAEGSHAPNAGLRYRILRRQPDGQALEVDPDIMFRSGDRVRLAFEPNVAGFLYVVQQGSSGRWSVLFPHPLIDGGRNAVSRFGEVVIPPEGWFRFDGNPGTERLLVYLSREPVSQLPGAAGPVVRAESVDDPTVIELANTVRSRDLVFEKEAGAAEASTAEAPAVYVVNRNDAGTAVLGTVELRHE